MVILYAHLVCNEWAVEKTINIIMDGTELISLVVVCWTALVDIKDLQNWSVLTPDIDQRTYQTPSLVQSLGVLSTGTASCRVLPLRILSEEPKPW